MTENNVVIEVRDDGRGINYHNIVNSAISKGLITEDKASELDERI